MLRIFSGCVVCLLLVDFVAGKDDPSAKLIAGKPVEANAKLSKGDKLVGVFDKKNYIVEILDIKSDKKLKIRWVATQEISDNVVPSELYYEGDATPTRKFRKSPLPDAYQAIDKNKDGQIGLYEWDRAKYAEFRKLDKNRDGFLTPQELTGKSVAVGAATAKEGDSKDSKDTKELDNPGNLTTYEDKVKMSFTFKVTGKVGGSVWGAGPYAVESDLAAAAVHAGVLKEGASGSVKVTILEPVSYFDGTLKNGVTSEERSESGPAFSVEALK